MCGTLSLFLAISMLFTVIHDNLAHHARFLSVQTRKKGLCAHLNESKEISKIILFLLSQGQKATHGVRA